MSNRPTRRNFLSQLGVTVAAGAAVGGSAGLIGAGVARADEKPKGTIPDKPFKIGHMTFFTGAGAVLGEPMYKGNLLAAEEINAQGGLLGKRKIEILKADEAAGTDANTKEMRRLKLSDQILRHLAVRADEELKKAAKMAVRVAAKAAKRPPRPPAAPPAEVGAPERSEA